MLMLSPQAGHTLTFLKIPLGQSIFKYKQYLALYIMYRAGGRYPSLPPLQLIMQEKGQELTLAMAGVMQEMW